MTAGLLYFLLVSAVVFGVCAYSSYHSTEKGSLGTFFSTLVHWKLWVFCVNVFASMVLDSFTEER